MSDPEVTTPFHCGQLSSYVKEVIQIYLCFIKQIFLYFFGVPGAKFLKLPGKEMHQTSFISCERNIESK